MELNFEKLPIVYQALKDNNIDAWLITGRETIMKREPILHVLGDMDFIIATTLIFTKDEKCIAIVSPLDVECYKLIKGIDEVIEYPTTMEETIGEVLKRLDPKVLALDYSSDDAAGDGLTLGMYMMLQNVFKTIDFKGEVVSSFPVINKVKGIKTPSQIEKIKFCAIQAEKYLSMVPSICKEGTTSLDIFNFLQKVAYDDGYGMSWAESQCPGVSVDPNVPAGHMGIISTPIVKGYVINIDYGISHDGYCSDLQIMYYVLKDDEDDAPEHVKKAFYLVRDAIKAAAAFMKPGVTGFQVDQVARHMIVDEGFDSWNAALGHQVGHETHDGGTILANRRPRYNKPNLIDTPLDAGNVFAVEPSVEIAEGRVGVEEDVLITENGGVFLAPPQQELILIRLQK
ncbi:MAG: aminopeptidase P family protein [Oscillospiraceae bacterium]|nr:aminopeptidase P family protein [Oscillospiraceae bacterium]